jgi:hypothetical protein
VRDGFTNFGSFYEHDDSSMNAVEKNKYVRLEKRCDREGILRR